MKRKMKIEVFSTGGGCWSANYFTKNSGVFNVDSECYNCLNLYDGIIAEDGSYEYLDTNLEFSVDEDELEAYKAKHNIKEDLVDIYRVLLHHLMKESGKELEEYYYEFKCDIMNWEKKEIEEYCRYYEEGVTVE